jgi:hypothetical protein
LPGILASEKGKWLSTRRTRAENLDFRVDLAEGALKDTTFEEKGS